MGKFDTLLKNATGEVQFTLTNDYLFRATWQQSEKALRGLICSILDLQYEDIKSVEIMNPIELGKSIDAKDFILDSKVMLNNHTIINLEMQVLNLGNWPERSLAYMCRSFDRLNRGDDYVEVKPVVQVCFLDFTLFKEYPEFFSTYMFTNVKNHMIYSDKLKLYVVDLTCIDRATEEDKLRGIYHWAKLFKATTWEEIKMLAGNNTFLEEAAETAYRLSAEEKIRMQCEAREDYYRQQRYIQKQLDRLKELESREQDMIANTAALVERAAELQENNVALQESNATLQESNATLQEDNATLQEDNATLQESNATLQEDNAVLQKDNASLKEENETLLKSNEEKDAEIARLKSELAKRSKSHI